jgi:hypothetical protein
MNVGTRIRQLIARGASMNYSRRSHLKVNERYTITATDISFTSPGTIASAGSGFGSLAAGGIITVVGSPLNSRDYVVETASAASITVSPAILTTESAGATIQVYEG